MNLLIIAKHYAKVTSGDPKAVVKELIGTALVEEVDEKGPTGGRVHPVDVQLRER